MNALPRRARFAITALWIVCTASFVAVVIFTGAPFTGRHLAGNGPPQLVPATPPLQAADHVDLPRSED